MIELVEASVSTVVDMEAKAISCSGQQEAKEEAINMIYVMGMKRKKGNTVEQRSTVTAAVRIVSWLPLCVIRFNIRSTCLKPTY